MGLLDDLKQQADSLREKQQVTQAEINQNLLKAHDSLKEALHYWIELFNSLNVIKPVIPRFYYLESAVKMENLPQQDYNVNGRRLTVDHKDYIEAIVLRFSCVKEGKITIEKQSEAMVKRTRDHLWGYSLKFDVKELRNERGYVERGIFIIANEVPVNIVISCDLEKGHIKIVTRNLEKFGEYTYIFDFDEFGKDVMEELAKVIIAKPNNFRMMGRAQAATAARSSATRPQEREPEPEPEPEEDVSGGNDEPTRSFIGNIRSILKR